ncbi:MAG: transglycosylase SLT domain-containing protein [Desulfatibacillaceae bacterium]
MRHMMSVCVALLAVLTAAAAPVCAEEDFHRYNQVEDYDQYFRKYSKRFFGPGFDWRFFKAQAIAESRLDLKAKSHVGAEGLMQIMPTTFEEIRSKLDYIKGSPLEPRWNIAAGVYYDRNLWKTWKARRPFQDRMSFTFGSFNAGKGNVLRAQKIAAQEELNPNLWGSIQVTLPKVTGRQSGETIHYVDNIFEIKEVLR